jgi:hypothetical protein
MSTNETCFHCGRVLPSKGPRYICKRCGRSFCEEDCFVASWKPNTPHRLRCKAADVGVQLPTAVRQQTSEYTLSLYRSHPDEQSLRYFIEDNQVAHPFVVETRAERAVLAGYRKLRDVWYQRFVFAHPYHWSEGRTAADTKSACNRSILAWACISISRITRIRSFARLRRSATRTDASLSSIRRTRNKNSSSPS